MDTAVNLWHTWRTKCQSLQITLKPDRCVYKAVGRLWTSLKNWDITVSVSQSHPSALDPANFLSCIQWKSYLPLCSMLSTFFFWTNFVLLMLLHSIFVLNQWVLNFEEVLSVLCHYDLFTFWHNSSVIIIVHLLRVCRLHPLLIRKQQLLRNVSVAVCIVDIDTV